VDITANESVSETYEHFKTSSVQSATKLLVRLLSITIKNTYPEDTMLLSF
jgi:hypothetical protein